MIGTGGACLFVQKRVVTAGTCARLVYGRDPSWATRSADMSFADFTHNGATLEECLDELSDFAAGMERYAPSLLAVALRVHLGALLQALLEGRLCSGEEVREFIRELERDALQDLQR
jgi:hypothetical protein